MTAPRLSLTVISFAADDPGGWEHLSQLAVAADRAGIGGLAVSDHVVFGEQLDAYGDPASGGTAGGRQPTGPDGHWLEPLTTITWLAARTERIRFVTNILLAALRRPAVLAKSAATIDVLSGGRLDLGVGVGWQRAEYEAAGLAFEERGARLDHTLDVLQTLWREPVADFADDHLAFSSIHQMPKPTRPGGVPVWVSGTVNPRSMRRLARFGSGWIPWGADAADLVDSIPRMRAAVVDAGGDPEGLGVVGTLPVVTDADGGFDVDATMAPVPALLGAGVTDFRLAVRLDPRAGDTEERLRVLVEGFEVARTS
jgi:probable F420-dependent oxidoreductase